MLFQILIPILIPIVKHILTLMVLSVFFERLLIKFGFFRGNTLLLIIFSIILISLMNFIWLGNIPDNTLIIYIFAIVFVFPLSANRYDLMGTFTKGRWWWKSEDNR